MTSLTLAHYPHKAGHTPESGYPSVTVTCVPYGAKSDITFRPYAAGYKSRSQRPYILAESGRRFATLRAAVAALLRERQIA